MQIKVGTDFSGIGSPEMALKLLGIDHKQIFACEIDKYARKSFEAIHGKPNTFYEDITKRNYSEVPQLDLYVAGFPCQAFSMAGKRKGFDDVRGTLFFNVADFIRINQPKSFILENVKGLLSHDNGNTFQTIKSLLSDNGGTVNSQMYIPYFLDGLGYHIYYKVLNTKEFGIPQNRERIFIVGFKEFREFGFPKPFPLELRLKDMLQDNPDYKYFLSDKQLHSIKNSKHEHSARIHDIDGCSPTIMAKSGGGHEPYIETPIDDKYFLSDKMIEYFKNHNDRHEKKGTGFQWQPKDEYDIANALRSNAALNATDNSLKTDQYKIRRLTPLECFRLQGFPDEAFFRAEKVNSDTQLYKQAGNSITVNVMMELLKKIFNI